MLTFSQPLFLYFLAGMAVPVFLHLLNLRQTRRVVFPSIEFLRRTHQPQNGRRRIRDVFVMLLRMLSIGAAAVLLAGPRWQPVNPSEDASEKTCVIVLDVSSSMAWGQRMARALEKLRACIGELDGWKIGIVPTVDEDDAAGGCLAVPPTHEHWRLDEALPTYKATHARGNPPGALAKACGWLTGRTKKLLAISDFQTTDWRSRMAVVPPDVDLELFDVKSDAEQGNCGIANITCRRMGARRLRVVATVSNMTGREAACDLAVQVDSAKQVETMALPAHGTLRQAFVFDNVELGRPCRAWLSADCYPHDDAYVFWGDGAPPQAVLLAVNSGLDSLAGLEVQYVKAALESETDGSGRRFTTAVTESVLMEPSAIERSQAVFLLGGCDGIQSDCIDALKQLLARGGVVFVTPGKSAGSDVRFLRGLGLDFGRFQGLSGASGESRYDGVARISPQSALWPLYSRIDESDMYSFAIRRCMRLIPPQSCVVHVWSLSGLPLLLECPFGRGRCYLSAFGYSDWWGDFQLTNSFLPMLHELLLSAVPEDYGWRRLPCGAKILEPESGIPMDTAEPQLYRTAQEYIEVNADGAESVDDYVDRLDVRELVRMNDADAAHGAKTPSEGTELTRALGWMLLAVFLFEMLLAASLARKS